MARAISVKNILLLLLLATPSAVASDPNLVNRDSCAGEILKVGAKLWSEPLVRGRTLNGQYDPAMTLYYRLRSYHEASPELAAHLTIGPEGFHALIKSATEGTDSALHLLPLVEAHLSADDKKKLVATLEAAQRDSVIRDIAFQQLRLGRILVSDRSELLEPFAYDPAVFPMLANLLASVDRTLHPVLEKDFSSRYSVDKLAEIGQLSGHALREQANQHLIQIFASPLNLRTDADVVLTKNQHALDVKQYITSLIESPGFQNIDDLNTLIVKAWKTYFGDIVLQSKNLQQIPNTPFVNIVLSKIGLRFVQAMTFYLKGRNDDAKRSLHLGLDQLAPYFILSKDTRQNIEARFLEASQGPHFRILILGEFIARGKLSPEQIFAQMALKNFNSVSQGTAPPPQPFIARPQQVPMVSVLLQYAFIKPGARILEIGHQTPVIPMALQYYLPHIAHTVCLDLHNPLSAQRTDELRKANIRIEVGDAPRDVQVTQKISASGPYDVIYGVDVFRTTYGGNGLDFDPSINREKYLQWIHSQLVDGGVFIIFNDNRAEPNFLKSELAEANLNIVRWGEDWPLNPSLRELLATRDKSTGEMSLFVFRKGKPPAIPEAAILTK